MRPTIFKNDKILHHLPRVVSWLSGQNPFAITVEIDATNICNHKCPGCCGFAVPNYNSLEISEMKNIIYEVKMLGGKAIIFTGGGEPLCNPDTVEAIRYADLCGLDVGLITNGGLLGKVNRYEILKSCKWVRISLDGGTHDVHETTHGSSDFDTIVFNIKELVRLKKENKYKCVIGTAYLTGIGTNSKDKIMDFIDLSISLGVDYAQLRPFLSYGKNDLHDFIPLDLNEFYEKSNDVTKIVASDNKYNSFGMKRSYDICYGHQFATTICANGDMTVCCHTRGIESMTIGSVKIDSLYDILNSDKRKEVARSIELDKCPVYCRCDTFNKILWDIKSDRDHVNFL